MIIDAALQAIRRPGGYGRMTIRGLAGEMGVAPMSLYRHVRDKDDILDAVVDRLLAEFWRPPAVEEDRSAWIADAADTLREFLVSQPAALYVYLQHPVVSPTAIARMEAMMRILREWLQDEEAARQAYAAIHTYTVGFSALEASRSGARAALTARATPASFVKDDAPIDNKSAGRDLAEQLARYASPHQFARGLRYLLAGIEHEATHKTHEST